MIVTCPSCSARYKINESKVKGRGAKITCPRCAHRFVFYREGEDPGGGKADDPVAQLDFRNVGITWKARSQGVVMEFTSLGTLLGWLHDGKIDTVDQISYNGRKWLYIEQVPDLSHYFAEIHRKASRGEISLYGDDDDGEDEDDSDAPTTIAGRGSSIAAEISDAVRDAATPRPAEPRSLGSDPDEDGGHNLVDDHGTPIPVIAPKGSNAPHPSPFASRSPPGPAKPEPAAPVAPVAPKSAAPAVAPVAPAPKPSPRSAPPVSAGAATAGAAATGGVAMLAMGGAVAVVIALVAAAGLYFGGFVGGQSGPDAAGGDAAEHATGGQRP